MKRNQMLLIIAKLLYQQSLKLDDYGMLALTDFHDSRDEWMADADEILTQVECLGMVPPFLEEPFDRSLGESKVYVKNYKWEKE